MYDGSGKVEKGYRGYKGYKGWKGLKGEKGCGGGKTFMETSSFFVSCVIIEPT
jgi:hypothetical protein